MRHRIVNEPLRRINEGIKTSLSNISLEDSDRTDELCSSSSVSTDSDIAISALRLHSSAAGCQQRADLLRMQSKILEGASKARCQRGRTNRILLYYIFMCASIVAPQLVAKSLKGERSHQGYCSVRNAVSKDRLMSKYEKYLSNRMKSRSSGQGKFRLDGLSDAP